MAIAKQTALIGGSRYLKPEDIKEETKVHIKTYAEVDGKFGIRYDFDGTFENGKHFTLSSWNIASDSRFNPDDLCHKDVVLRPSDDAKKIFLVLPL
jgi:hypothetical protein